MPGLESSSSYQVVLEILRRRKIVLALGIEADQIALDVIVARSQEFQLQVTSNALAQLEGIQRNYTPINQYYYIFDINAHFAKSSLIVAYLASVALQYHVPLLRYRPWRLRFWSTKEIISLLI